MNPKHPVSKEPFEEAIHQQTDHLQMALTYAIPREECSVNVIPF